MRSPGCNSKPAPGPSGGESRAVLALASACLGSSLCLLARSRERAAVFPLRHLTDAQTSLLYAAECQLPSPEPFSHTRFKPEDEKLLGKGHRRADASEWKVFASAALNAAPARRRGWLRELCAKKKTLVCCTRLSWLEGRKCQMCLSVLKTRRSSAHTRTSIACKDGWRLVRGAAVKVVLPSFSYQPGAFSKIHFV